MEKMRQAQIAFLALHIQWKVFPFASIVRRLQQARTFSQSSHRCCLHPHISEAFGDKYAVCIRTGISMYWFTQKMKIQQFKSSADELCLPPSSYLIQLKKNERKKKKEREIKSVTLLLPP